MVDIQKRQGFRKDINGLRAVAVAIVVLYHFNATRFHGGFVGVDLFFVISGFLMTQIIVLEMQACRFSISEFMWSRFKRIMPALAVMVGLLMIVGWFLVEPLGYQSMSSAAAASVGFYSNILYLQQSSYFAAASEQNWLLHTWSLSVEWQFYMLYPIFLIAANQFRQGRALLPLLAALTVLSFGLCVWMSQLRGAWAFYMLPFRSWELTAGGLVFLLASRRSPAAEAVSRSLWIELTGLALLLLSSTLLRPGLIWPGYWAAAPVLGAMAVIWSNRGERSLLVAKPLQVVGQSSYSIYLWHWPFIVIFRYFDVLSLWWAAPAGIGLSLIVGWFSFIGVERPFDERLRGLRVHWQRLAAISVPAALVALAIGISASGGAPGRAAGNSAVADTIDAREQWEFSNQNCDGFRADGEIKTCHAGGTKQPGVLVIGDSEAQEWFPRYASASFSQSSNSAVLFATHAGCMPIPSFERSDPGHRCATFAKQAFAIATAGKFKRVVLIAAWNEYLGDPALSGSIRLCRIATWGCTFEPDRSSFLESVAQDLIAQISQVRHSGAEVVVVLPFPVPGTDLPQEIAKRAFINLPLGDLPQVDVSTYLTENKDVRELLIRVANDSGASTVDPLSFMCSGANCPLVDEQGRSLYKDAVHLRPSVARSRFGFLDAVVSD